MTKMSRGALMRLIDRCSRVENITVTLSNTEMVPEGAMNVADSDDMEPVYGWYDEDSRTLYFASTSKKVSMPGNSSFLFEGLEKLTNIKGLAKFDASYIEDATCMFYQCTDLVNYQPLNLMV